MASRSGHPLRITFVLPNLGMAGGSRVVAIYADRLRRRGHEVTVVAGRVRTPSLPAKVRSLVKGYGWPRVSHTTLFEDLSIRCHVIDRARPITERDVPDADVIIATWWETAEWVARFAPRKGAKVYLLQHDESTFAHDPARAAATWTLPMHKIVVARWLVDVARERCGLDEPVALVPNSVDTKQFHAPPRGKQPVPTVGVMYSRTRFKGVDISLSAFAEAARAVPGLRLVAFGHKPPTPDLPLPANAKYVVSPPQEQIRELYAACDAWLFGSRTEGFGLPILEAMACRTPVIATPAGAAPELVGQGGGILVKTEDPSYMARAIQQIARLDDGAWRRMSDAALATTTQYSWDDATDLFEAALLRAARERETHVSSALASSASV
jgi:glycosyltransferase involved in cell wall biosynthesis